MIRINLLPHKKKHKAVPVEGEQTVAIGMGIVLAFAGALYFFVHGPKTEELEKQQQANQRLKSDNDKISERTKDFDQLKAAFESAKLQQESIKSLNNARATPAYFLHELATILKSGGEPTMTKEMAKKVKENENLAWQREWDPKHVWVTSIVESQGTFTLIGSAQSDGDVTQLTHRLSASAYFSEIKPLSSDKKEVDGNTVYNFRISGKVRY